MLHISVEIYSTGPCPEFWKDALFTTGTEWEAKQIPRWVPEFMARGAEFC
jgi:hypothetical protein